MAAKTPRPAPLSQTPASPSLGLAVALAGLSLMAWMLTAMWPRLLLLLGIQFKETWFLDSYAILATLDARRAGIDPLGPNPLDVLHRAHVYSDWWYALDWLGLTREENFIVGTCWVLGFLAVAVMILRARRWREVVAGFAVLVSPPVLLAVNRGNNDLVIFMLLAGAALFLASGRTSQLTVAGLLVAFATGLKFYPAVAFAFVLLVRPVSRFLALTAGLGLVLGLVVWNVWSQAGRGVFEMPQDVHKLGALILLRDLGLPQATARVAAAGLIFGVGIALARQRWTGGLASVAVCFRERGAFVIGAAVLLACFLTGISFAYRWIFVLLLLPWLWRTEQIGVADAPPRWIVRLTFTLIFFSVWADGVYCAVFNLAQIPLSPQAMENLNKVLRLCIQPFQWLLFMLLAGWLAELLFSTGEEWRRSRRAAGELTPA